MKSTAILGISNNPERYSYKAFKKLQLLGIPYFLVSPKLNQLEDDLVYSDLKTLSGKVHTLTIYINPHLSSSILEEILALLPKRIIFNPGAENKELQEKAQKKGIECLNACTLVLLATNQF